MSTQATGQQTTSEVTSTPAECMGAKPQQEHEWLHKMVGEWTCVGEAIMGPDQPPVKWEAAESVRSIGGMWVMGEGSGDTPTGEKTTTIITLGYDPQKQRFVGSFVGSMMSNMWIYEGTLDAGGNVLTLDTEGPVMGPGGGITKYQDIVELKSDDERTLTSRMLGEDGQWRQVMTATYRRKAG